MVTIIVYIILLLFFIFIIITITFTMIITTIINVYFSPLGRTLPRIHSHKSASLPARGKDADMPPVLDLLRVAPEDLATQITRMDFPVFKYVKFGRCFCSYSYYGIVVISILIPIGHGFIYCRVRLFKNIIVHNDILLYTVIDLVHLFLHYLLLERSLEILPRSANFSQALFMHGMSNDEPYSC